MTDETTWTGGYGTPPYGTRFQKGVSGNPAGRKARPNPSRAVGDIALDHLRKKVWVQNAQGKKIKMPMLDAIIVHGGQLAATCKSPYQVTRYLASLEKLGFNYMFEDGRARTDERREYEALVSTQYRALDACHEQIRRSEREIARLNQKIAKLKGETPADGPSAE